jgi:hypothetical protein
MPTDASAAVSDTLAQDHRARDMAQVAVFAALIAALTLVPGVPLIGSSVPFTLQTLGVTLAGAVLGPRKGALAVLVYLAMIAVGLPVASGYKGGLGVLTGPTGGYLVGFVLAAAVVGFPLAPGAAARERSQGDGGPAARLPGRHTCRVCRGSPVAGFLRRYAVQPCLAGRRPGLPHRRRHQGGYRCGCDERGCPGPAAAVPLSVCFAGGPLPRLNRPGAGAGGPVLGRRLPGRI